ncbi:MAG: hypothetical protein ABOK23_09145 [Candidatus Methanoperedens sp.]|nr:hypothetical protein [Candidatus Methanoperedens sp.]MCZ7394295.1 hypothetical protein [Candidatus Methanoperedens sp.]
MRPNFRFWEPHRIAVRTAEDIGKILTRELLPQSIREKTPESKSRLARMLKRMGSNGNGGAQKQ